MVNLPSSKSHPVLMSMACGLLIIGSFIGGNISGWTLRVMSESRAELSVVVDDGKFESLMKETALMWGDAFNVWEEDFREKYPDIPDCLASPMPRRYHDNDAELWSNGESERGEFD